MDALTATRPCTLVQPPYACVLQNGNGAPPAAAKKEASAATPKAAAPAVPAVAEVSFAGDRAGAQAWIKNWKDKQPKPAFSFKMPW